VGEPVWKAFARGTERALGKVGLGPALVTRFGQPREYREASRERRKAVADATERALDMGNRLVKDLNQFEQQALGRFVKGEATPADLLKVRGDARWFDAVEAAKQARAELDSLGAEAVAQGLLKDEVFFRNYGKYMPRLYRKYEVGYEETLQKFGEKKPERLDLSRFQKREDIPEEIRLLMGEIKEPAFPVAKGVSQLAYDVETMRLFNMVAKRQGWTFTDLEALRKAGRDPNNYVEMPESKKLGPLSGKLVQRYIAEDLNRWAC